MTVDASSNGNRCDATERENAMNTMTASIHLWVDNTGTINVLAETPPSDGFNSQRLTIRHHLTLEQVQHLYREVDAVLEALQPRPSDAIERFAERVDEVLDAKTFPHLPEAEPEPVGTHKRRGDSSRRPYTRRTGPKGHVMASVERTREVAHRLEVWRNKHFTGETWRQIADTLTVLDGEVISNTTVKRIIAGHVVSQTMLIRITRAMEKHRRMKQRGGDVVVGNGGSGSGVDHPGGAAMGAGD